MTSELELLRQRITELEAENTKLRQIIEENTKREAENTELNYGDKCDNDRQPTGDIIEPKNDKDVSSEVSVVVVSNSSPIHEVYSQIKLSEQIEEVPKLPDQEETSEDMEIDAFLVEVHKKSISNDIRKHNKEKKLSKAGQDQVSLQKISDTASGISSSEKLISTKNGQALIQEISHNLAESATSSSIQENGSTCALSPNPGFVMKANQEEILSWYLYAKEFLIIVKDIMANDRVGEKKAKGQIYDFIVQQLPNTKRDNLCKQTQRAIKIFDLFEKIGIDKIRYIKTYSANSISKITNTDLQKVIDYFSNNSNSFTEPEFSPTLGRPNHVTKISETIANSSLSADEEEYIKMLTGSANQETNDDNVCSHDSDSNSDDSDFNANNSDSDVYFKSDDSDSDDGYGGYNEYGERDRGYYCRDGGYERKTSPMISPIISPVTA
ncbi:hypothetical protein RhiirA4_471361 [Rhizophagus irregularis]|uniref:Uncharacterized protein n=1 Tax=Rhizophagus irregularis TaxID=588596 RepID=A0A2I1H2Z1_9GLOM|nr:hypothetical protein RhiirA4_471361 [Rhizophagus irregularis]